MDDSISLGTAEMADSKEKLGAVPKPVGTGRMIPIIMGMRQFTEGILGFISV